MKKHILFAFLLVSTICSAQIKIMNLPSTTAVVDSDNFVIDKHDSIPSARTNKILAKIMKTYFTTNFAKVDTIYRKPGVDSIYFTCNGIVHAIKDSIGVASGTITGSGTTGTIPIFTGTSTQGNSTITQSGYRTGVNMAALKDLNVYGAQTNPIRGLVEYQYSGSNVNSARILGIKFRGTLASPTTIVTGDNLMSLVGYGYDGTDTTEAGRIEITSTGTIGTGIVPGLINLYTSNSSGVSTLAAYFDASQIFHLTNALGVNQGGTGGTTASITLFNNITGYAASGATGTTSTNLVFSTSPTLVTPILGTPTSGSLTNCTNIPVANATGLLPLANGGTNGNLTASSGGIVYSTNTAFAILAGTATPQQILMSNTTPTPQWSTATYPITTTVNQLLYSSSSNVIAGLATANNAILTTSSGGVPSLTAQSTFINSNAWGLTGNSGTTVGTNFIGTTDSAALEIKVHNQFAGYIDLFSNACTFFGRASGQANIIGTGLNNSYFGTSAGQKNTSGGNNVYIGQKAGQGNTTGSLSVLIGSTAGMSNNMAQCVAVGYGSLSNVTSLDKNSTAVGYLSLYTNQSGQGVCGLGDNSGYGNTTGSGGVFIGDSAGYANTTGSFNTAIGFKTSVGTNLTNATAIGNGATVTLSNTMQLGNSSVTGATIGTQAEIIGHTIFAPVTTGTVVLVDNQVNIINPSATIAALTVTFPSSPSNNDRLVVKYTQAVTAITYSGGTLIGGLASATAGSTVIFTYDSGTTDWY